MPLACLSVRSSPRPGPSLPGPCPPRAKSRMTPTAAPGTAPRSPSPTCQGARQQNQALTSVRRARVQWGPGIRAPPAWAAGPWGSCRPAPWWHLEGGSGEAGGLAGLEAGAAGRQRGCVCPHHCPLPPPMTSGLDSRPVLSRNWDRDLAPEGGTTSLAPGDARAGGVLGRRSLKLGLRVVVIIGNLSPDWRGRARAWRGVA